MAGSCLNLIKEKLRKEREKARVLAEAWEKVSYEVKKDGTPYKDMRKTISGASYRRIPYSCDPYYNELYVHAWGSYGNVEDSINVFSTDRSEISRRRDAENVHENIYIFDLGDIRRAVAERAEYWSCRAESLQKELEIADSAWEKYSRKLQDVIDSMEQEIVIQGNRELLCLIYDSMREKPTDFSG